MNNKEIIEKVLEDFFSGDIIKDAYVNSYLDQQIKEAIEKALAEKDKQFLKVIKKLKKEWKAKCKRMEVMSGEVADYELKCLLSEIMGEFKNGNNRRRKHT